MQYTLDILKTLTSYFYDLAKAVPIGQLNEALLNTIIVGLDGKTPIEVEYSDEELRAWAESHARQLIDYRTKFTREQLGTTKHACTVASDE